MHTAVCLVAHLTAEIRLYIVLQEPFSLSVTAQLYLQFVYIMVCMCGVACVCVHACTK
jgi:hypothetical protein